VKAAPLLFGYRGTERVDIAKVERLVLAIARLQNDNPSIRSLELPMVLSGGWGVAVLGATIRVDPVRDSRSGWFTRRLDPPVQDLSEGSAALVSP
jgi:hypothetical protein